MAALTEGRETPRRTGKNRNVGCAAVKCICGGIAVLNSSGFGQPGTTATGLTAIGVFDETIDNSAGSAGDERVEVTNDGAFHFGNSAGADEIAADDIGEDAYIVDDQTVALTSGGSTRSVAGKIFDVDATGVWITFEK